MKIENKMRLAVIAGASEALKFKEENPRANEQQILQHVSRESREVVKEILKDD